jgi:intracellular sulfur oxidation DsrE/DsrF family protein
MIRQLLICLVALMTAVPALAGSPQTGPVIADYGPVFEVPKGSYNLDTITHYKVSMDASATGATPGDINRHFVSAARFLNMQARNGIAPDKIEFALVVHGPAGKDLLDDASYKKRYQQSNPNTQLLKQLGDAGVTIYLCGQSAAYMKLKTEEMNPTVTIAVSAMTAHVRLQSEGYTLIPF